MGIEQLNIDWFEEIFEMFELNDNGILSYNVLGMAKMFFDRNRFIIWFPIRFINVCS